jgi:hypothetical protein
VEKFFDWKERDEVCEDEIPEHGSCLNLVGSSPSKASAERQREVHETRQDAIEVAGKIATLRLDPKLVLRGSLRLLG